VSRSGSTVAPVESLDCSRSAASRTRPVRRQRRPPQAHATAPL